MPFSGKADNLGQMPKIMSMFVFQNSRRQLLMMLMEKCDAASKHRNAHEQRGEPEGRDEKRKTDNLLKAIEAADEQVKKLEYWSDQRRLVREGMTGHIDGWNETWQGLDQSGPGSNSTSTSKEKGKTIDDVVHEESREQTSSIQSASEEDGTTLRSLDDGELTVEHKEEQPTLQLSGSRGGPAASDTEAAYQTAQETAAEDVEEMDPELGSSHAYGGDDPRMIERAKEWAKRQGKGKSKAVH